MKARLMGPNDDDDDDDDDEEKPGNDTLPKIAGSGRGEGKGG